MPAAPEPAPVVRAPAAVANETLTPVHFDEPGELAHAFLQRILAVVQARLDRGGKLPDDELVTEVEDVLRDNAR